MPDPAFLVSLLRPVVEERRNKPSQVKLSILLSSDVINVLWLDIIVNKMSFIFNILKC